MNPTFAAELEELVEKRVVHSREATPINDFAAVVRESAELPPSATLQTFYEETTLSIAGHREFMAFIEKYIESEQAEKSQPLAQKLQNNVKHVESLVTKEAERYSKLVSDFPTHEDERSTRPTFESASLSATILNASIPTKDEQRLLRVVEKLRKKAESIDDDMCAIQHMWANHGASWTPGLEGKALEKEQRDVAETIERLRDCDLSPDF